MSQAGAQLAVSTPNEPVAFVPTSGEQASWQQAGALPCAVSVEVPLPGLTLKALLELRAGSVLSSKRATTANVPLRVNGELVAWCEFEVMGSRLSVRLTELA